MSWCSTRSGVPDPERRTVSMVPAIGSVAVVQVTSAMAASVPYGRMALPLRLAVVYDFRNPPDSGFGTRDLNAEILEQVAWLDTLGLDLVWFTEHHFVDDGYLPSWT